MMGPKTALFTVILALSISIFSMHVSSGDDDSQAVKPTRACSLAVSWLLRDYLTPFVFRRSGALPEGLQKTNLYRRLKILGSVLEGKPENERAFLLEFVWNREYGKNLKKTHSTVYQKVVSVKDVDLSGISLKGTNERVANFSKTLDSMEPGGTYIGLAHEQNYDMIAHSRPEFVHLYDADPNPVVAHMVAKVAFGEANTPEEFLAFFSDKNSTRSSQLIQAAYRGREISTYFQLFAPDWAGASFFLVDIAA